MAGVDVNKNQKKEKAIVRRGENQPATWGNSDPFSWWRRARSSSPTRSPLMRRFREEMDRVFSRNFGEEFGGTWSPAIAVTEQNGNLQVRAELSGLKPEDGKIEATDDSLVIQGERKYEHEEKKEGVFRSERRYGKFYREIPLPEGAKVDQAKAQFKNGVLEVTLPVPERKNNRREIPIGDTSGSGESATQAVGKQNK